MQNPFRQAAEAFNQTNPAPRIRKFLTKEPRGKDADRLSHGAFVFKPFHHLTQLNAPQTQNFIDSQNARLEAFITQHPDAGSFFGPDAPEIPDIFVHTITQIGEAKLTRVEDYRTQNNYYFLQHNRKKTLVAKSDDEKDENVYFNAACNKVVLTKPEKRRKSSVYLRELNGDGTFHDTLIDKHQYAYALSVEWDKDGKGFEYNHYENSRFSLRHHQLGQDMNQDVTVMTAPEENFYMRRAAVRNLSDEPNAYEYVKLSYKGKSSFYCRKKGTEEPLRLLCSSANKSSKLVGEEKGFVYAIDYEEQPTGKLIRINLEDGTRKTILPQRDQEYLYDVCINQERILAQYTTDSDVLRLFDRNGQLLKDPVPIVSVSQVTGMYARPQNSFTIDTTGYTGKKTYHLTPEKLTLTVQHKNNMDVTVRRVEVPGKDGARIPLHIVMPKGVELDGTAAVKLIGYGGFNRAISPDDRADLRDWIKKGGIIARAFPRGDGVKPGWYDGGRAETKQNSFDDFAACAEYLIEQNYTRADRLAASGASNGGLLTLATALQRPELFGAVVSDVPVADMIDQIWDEKRKNWYKDYGNPRGEKGDFERAMAYSPLHTIRKGKTYPPMLVITGLRDTIVHASHALKFVAAMQDKSPETLCLLQTNKNRGHSAPDWPAFYKQMMQEQMFIEQAIGPIDQQAFKAEIAESMEKPAQTKAWTARVMPAPQRKVAAGQLTAM